MFTVHSFFELDSTCNADFLPVIICILLCVVIGGQIHSQYRRGRVSLILRQLDVIAVEQLLCPSKVGVSANLCLQQRAKFTRQAVLTASGFSSGCLTDFLKLLISGILYPSQRNLRHHPRSLQSSRIRAVVKSALCSSSLYSLILP